MTNQKQPRVLYTTLAVLLVTATVLSVLTFQADKKEKAPETETIETRIVEQARPSKKETELPQEKRVEEKKEDAGFFHKETETMEETEKTAAELPEEVLPTVAEPIPNLHLPIAEGEIVRTHSVTVPVYSPTMEDYRTHTGIDIACAAASPVLAAADGKIGNFWYDPMMGYTLSVVHSGNAVTLYQGLSEELPSGITPGASVTCGQTIASTGNTALVECADDEHLHFMLHVGGEAVDPMDFLEIAG